MGALFCCLLRVLFLKKQKNFDCLVACQAKVVHETQQFMRLRFAPSPTGPLHIGGVRTALYNYLLAKKEGGTFVLRIEDTDQTRYVPGAEAYIREALHWCGIEPDEGPEKGGAYGPYRQSERREIYRAYVEELIAKGKAYYAFDTPEELNARREAFRQKGLPPFKYDATQRMQMRNSLSLSANDVRTLLESGVPYTIRLKVEPGQEVLIQDVIRGSVVFRTEELDDKILFKADGMPTYHLANVVDDHLMKITHVIRGEEWLPSTAHHVLLYRAFGWEDSMPQFAHLPLILKPTGKGKLSKRDGIKLGIPVFPLSWEAEREEESFKGFREFGFDPRAVINFLAFLGWNPGTEQEIFSMDELIAAFSLDKIGKGGARFDYDKALWFNQQWIQQSDDAYLAEWVRPILKQHGHQPEASWLERFCRLFKERVSLYPDFWEQGYYLLEPVRAYDQKTLRKKWKPERLPLFLELAGELEQQEPFEAASIEQTVKAFAERHELKAGEVFPILRIALTGTTRGPGIFDIMELLGKEEAVQRLKTALPAFGRA